MLDGGRAAVPPGLEQIAGNLNFPVSFAFTPDGRIFFNELRTGLVRVLAAGRLLPQPLARLPVATGGERGLLGLALHPRFPAEPWVYVYHTVRAGLRTANRVTRLQVRGDRAVANETLPLEIPAGFMHNGGILGFQGGRLFITTGDTGRAELAQDLSSLAGKVLRVTPEGRVPADNPFPASPVFTLGHRNVFGLAFQPRTGVPFITENGPDRDDEINRLVPGGNYGWPQALGQAGRPGFIDPLITFTPNIAPTGAAFYTGRRYPPGNRGALFFGDWLTGTLRRLILRGRGPSPRVVALDPVAQVTPPGILAVVDGPDGFLYVSTATAIWRIAELSPRGAGTGPLQPKRWRQATVRP